MPRQACLGCGRVTDGTANGSRWCRDCYSTRSSVTGVLRQLGVLDNKHIPTVYLRASEALALELDRRGILYAPDFIANAGGLMHVYKEIKGYSEDHAVELVGEIEETLQGILDAARERGITPLEAARELARERLDAAAVAPA
jgi:hypothetical protein